MFYIFCSFTLLVSGENNILPNLTNSQEPEPVFFGPLEPEPEPEPLKKIPGAEAGAGAGAGAAWQKNQKPEPEPLEKKSGTGAGAAKKLAVSSALALPVKFLNL